MTQAFLPRLFGAGGGGGKKGGGAPVEAANTLQTNSIVRLIEMLGEGPIEAIEQVYLNETPLTDDNGEPNFEGIKVEYRLGLPSQPAVPGFSDQEAEHVVDAQVDKDTPILRTITDDLTDAVRVTIKIPALFEYKDNGDMVEASVSYRIQYRPAGGGAWIDIPGSPFTLKQEKNTSPAFLPYRFSLTGAAPWDVRVVRETDDSEDNTKLQNTISFYSYTEILEQKLTYPNSAYLAIEASAQQFGDSIPSRAALVKGLICRVPTNFDPDTRTYTGIWNGTFKTAWTDCPAWCVYDMATHERYGLGDFVQSSMLDPTTLYQISQYCAGMVDDGNGGTEHRFTFNAYIATRQEAYDLLNAMVSVFRGMIYWSLGTAMFAHDAPRDPILTVTRANTVNGDFTYQGASIQSVHNSVNVTYNNPEKFYKRDIVNVSIRTHIAKYGLRPKDIIAFGCTSRTQAIRAGRWLLYTERMESDVLGYVGGADHVDVIPGSIIRVMDPSVMGVSMGGRLAGYGSTSVTLDREVTLLAGESYELVVHDSDRVLHYRAVVSAPGAHTTLFVDAPLPPLTLNPYETVWAVRRITGPDTLYRVLSSSEVGTHQYEITAIQHSPDKFDIIENGYEIPAYPLPILPGGPLVPPENLNVSEQVVETSGTENTTTLFISITRPPDARVRGVEVIYRRLGQAWETLDLRGNTSFTLGPVPQSERYQFQARVYDALGNYSRYSDAVNIETSGNPVSSTVPPVTDFSVIGGLNSVIARWKNPTNYPAFKEVVLLIGLTTDVEDAVAVGSTPAESLSITGLSTGATRHVWATVVAHGTPLRYGDTVYLGAATASEVGSGDIDTRGLAIRDVFGNVVFGPNGYIGDSAFITVDGNNVFLSEVAANSLVPALHYVGEYSSPPTQLMLGDDWRQNAVYKNTVDGHSYVLTGSPLAWQIYLSDGLAFQVAIESTNGTIFRPGTGQSTLLKGRLFKNGADVTDVTPASWFRWRRVSLIPAPPPNDDATWNSLYLTGYKEVSINVDQVNARATFFCDILSA